MIDRPTLFGLVAITLLAGCLSDTDAAHVERDPSGRNASGDAVVGAYVHEQQLRGCPDYAFFAHRAKSELQTFLPEGFVAGDAQDMYLALGPLGAFRPSAGAAPLGVAVVFIQSCLDDPDPQAVLDEGAVYVYLETPSFDTGLEASTFDIYVVDNAVGGQWMRDWMAPSGWQARHASTTLDVAADGSSARASWVEGDVSIVTMSSSAVLSGPALPYDIVVRAWQKVPAGLAISDHIASGDSYPAQNLVCDMHPDSKAAKVTGMTVCDGSRQERAFIFPSHDPRMRFAFFPDARVRPASMGAAE